MDATRRALVSVPIVAALAWAATLCVSAANANVIASAAPADVAALQRALEWAPADAELHEHLGAALLKQGAGAMPELERAVLLRPTSPYAWASYAEARYQEGRTGTAFEEALLRAASLGPNEPEVQESVALYGLAVWNDVRADTRETIGRMVAAGMKRDPSAMLRIADRRGRLEVACAHVDGVKSTPDLHRLCTSRGTLE